MRIIEWNCQGAFRLKNKAILNLSPDILIIPECENEEKLQFGKLTSKPNDFIWYGDSENKGIAICSYSDYKLRVLKEFNPEFRYVIPIEVYNETNSFLLFAIWAMDNKKDPLARYIGQVWKAINYYQSALTNNSIIIGDFNSNQIWDDKERVGNHTDVVNFLNKYQIESLYHKQSEEKQGQESLKTFFLYRNIEKSYHIDYAFVSQELITNGYNLQLGKPQDWIDKSDHVPLILDIQNLNSKTEIQNTFMDFTKRHLSQFDEQTKIKFHNELILIEEIAEQLDLHIPTEQERIALIDKIETIKKIDKLIRQFNALNSIS